MAKQKALSETYVGEHTAAKDIFEQIGNNYTNKNISDYKKYPLKVNLRKIPNEIGKYYLFHKRASKNIKDIENIFNYNKSILSRSSQIDAALHKNWWAKLSTVEKLRNHPREFLSYGTFGLFFITLFLLLTGLLLDRIIIAPDFGVSILFISLIFWLMTQFSK